MLRECSDSHVHVWPERQAGKRRVELRCIGGGPDPTIGKAPGDAPDRPQNAGMRELDSTGELVACETRPHAFLELGRQAHLYLNEELHRGAGYSPVSGGDPCRGPSYSPSVTRLVRDTAVRPEGKDISWPL